MNLRRLLLLLPRFRSGQRKTRERLKTAMKKAPRQTVQVSIQVEGEAKQKENTRRSNARAIVEVETEEEKKDMGPTAAPWVSRRPVENKASLAVYSKVRGKVLVQCPRVPSCGIPSHYGLWHDGSTTM